MNFYDKLFFGDSGCILKWLKAQNRHPQNKTFDDYVDLCFELVNEKDTKKKKCFKEKLGKQLDTTLPVLINGSFNKIDFKNVRTITPIIFRQTILDSYFKTTGKTNISDDVVDYLIQFGLKAFNAVIDDELIFDKDTQMYKYSEQARKAMPDFPPVDDKGTCSVVSWLIAEIILAADSALTKYDFENVKMTEKHIALGLNNDQELKDVVERIG